MRIEWKSCFRVCVCAFLLYLAIYYWQGIANLGGLLVGAAMPLVIGGSAAYIVNILMNFYERKIPLRSKAWAKARRPVCMLLALLSVVVGAMLLVRLIVPQLISCFQVLLSALPDALNKLYLWLDEKFTLSAYFSENIPSTSAEWRALIEKSSGVLLSGFGGAMDVVISAATSVVGGVITAFMSLIFCIYILSGKEKLRSQFSRLVFRTMGESRTAKLKGVLHIVDDCFHDYIVGQCLEALILGGLCTAGMLLLRLPYAIMIGAMIGVTALIPVAGAYIGAAFGAVMIFSVNPIQALIFLVFLIILQQLEGNLIYPRTVGSSLGLPAIWVLAAVTIGGGVLGVGGMVLFVPLTAAAYRLVGNYVRTGEIVPSKS